MPAKGDGISRRKDGRYVGRYTVHTPEGPKRKVIYGRKYKEVEQKLAEARGDAVRGLVFDAEGQTLGQWLERWLEDVVKPNKGHRTYATHCQQVRSHIAPAIGRIKLEALRKFHIDRLYLDLLRAKPEGVGLAPSSVRRIHAVLHAALEEAVRGDLIPRNPATHANKPKVRQEEIKTPRHPAGASIHGRRPPRQVRSALRPLPHGRAKAGRGTRTEVVRHRSRRRILARESPVAACATGRGKVRQAGLLRAEERFSPGRGIASEDRRNSQKPPQAPAGGEAKDARLRGLGARVRV